MAGALSEFHTPTHGVTAMRLSMHLGLVCGCVTMLLALSACGGPARQPISAGAISLEEFVASPGSIDRTSQAEPARNSLTDHDEAQAKSAIAPFGGTKDAADLSDAPPPIRLEPGQQIVVDSLVGQINGRPVFADDFFAPIDSKLRRFHEQLTPRRFDAALEEEVDLRLRELVENELLLAQAQLRLTPEQQQGLFHWLTEQRKLLKSQGGGTIVTAEKRFRKQYGEGVTFEDVMDERRKAALIQFIYESEIAPRVIVSWKDIETAYKQNYELFNPPGRVRIAFIRVDPDRDAEQIEMVKTKLAAGADFMTLVDEVGRDGSSDWYPIPEGGFGAIEDFTELYRQHLAGLEVGETVGPFTHELSPQSRREVWVHIAEIDKPPGQSIYDRDIQIELRRLLIQRRRAIEEARYFNEQLGESILADLSDLRERLKALGEKRYQ